MGKDRMGEGAQAVLDDEDLFHSGVFLCFDVYKRLTYPICLFISLTRRHWFWCGVQASALN